MYLSADSDDLARRSVLVCGIATLLLGVLFVLLLAASYGGPIALRWLYWGIAGISACTILVYGARRCFAWLAMQELFSPLFAFPVAYLVWYSLGLLALLDESETRVLPLSAIGFLCFLAGALLYGRNSWVRIPRSKIRYDWNDSIFWPVMVTLGLMAVLSYLYVVSQMGIPILDPEAAEQRLEVVKYGPSEAVFFTSSWTLLVFLGARLWTMQRLSVLHRGLTWTAIGVVALMLLSLGSRGYLFVPLLTAVIARHFLKKRFHPLALVTLGCGMFIGLSVYGYLRDSTAPQSALTLHKENVRELAVFPLIYAYLYVRQPVDTFQQVTEIIPRTIPYQRGTLTFGALRTLLPGHHEMSDMFFKQILGSDFIGGGQPATLLGPLYGDFGVAGIVIGMFAIGVLMGKTYSWMGEHPTVFRVVIYAWVMQTLLFSLFGAIIPYITTLWIPFFWWFVHTTFLKQPAWRAV